ncbi:NF038122 family metalloprotease [Glacieibacterium sp.]|uniref:NF038122 family metalloprotease n=1 Tax=Glacieibacterium sp. TaxID=2860237 RepID=UPI003AFFB25A
MVRHDAGPGLRVRDAAIRVFDLALKQGMTWMRFVKLLVAGMLAGTAIAPASALTFHLTDTGGAGAGTQARSGFEAAAAYWSSVLKDNVTVNLNIGFSSLGAGILGSTGSARSVLSMGQTYNALGHDITSKLDQKAVAGLQPLSPSALGPGIGSVAVRTNAFNATNNGYVDTATRLDNDHGVDNSALAVTTASAKAMGLTTDVSGTPINYAATDGSITFSNLFAFDFNPMNGIDALSYDFIGVAIHEIGHALGFVSGVDGFDAFTGTTGGTLENFVVSSQLDLFRYNAAGELDWSTQAVPFFSLDGSTQLFGNSRFSTGVNNGDGNQASHWKDSAAGAPQLGILDPTSGRGQMQAITALDLAAFDAIGWDIAFNPLDHGNYRFSTARAYAAFNGLAVPEPATWVLMIGGFGLVGGALRRQRRTGYATA